MIYYEKVGMSLADWFGQIRSGAVRDSKKINIIYRDHVLCYYWMIEIRRFSNYRLLFKFMLMF